MSQVRGQLAMLMAPGLRKIYDDVTQYEQQEKSYPVVFNVETSTKQYEQDLEMAALGPLQEKPENTSTAYNMLIQGGAKRAYHLTYSLGIRSSKELVDDDQYGMIGNPPQLLYVKRMVVLAISLGQALGPLE